MRNLGVFLTVLFLTSTTFAKPKVEEKIVRSPGHTTIIYKDYTAKKKKAVEKPKAQATQAVDFREYDVGDEVVYRDYSKNAGQNPQPVSAGQSYSQSYTPGPNRGMAANGGGSFSSGFLQTNGYAYGFGWGNPGYGYGYGYAPAYSRGYGPGLRAVGVPAQFQNMPQQRFAPPPLVGAGYRATIPVRGRGCR